MKLILKKFFKIVLVFLISTIIVYSILVTRNFIRFCDYAQISVFGSEEKLLKADNEKLKVLGEDIGKGIMYADLLEEAREESPYKDDGKEHSFDDGHEHTIGDFYDPLGFSVMENLQSILNYIVDNGAMTIFCSLAITIAYIVITCKKINNILKFLIGYIGVIIACPPLYMYSWTGRFWEINVMYENMPKYFYIGYTIIFVLMCCINYIIAKKMTKELNEAIKGESKE